MEWVPDILSGIDAHLVTGEAAFTMTREGERAAQQAYAAASGLTREARHLVHEALMDAEVARHIGSGDDMMDDWRRRVDGGQGTMWGHGPEVADFIRIERRRILGLVEELIGLR